MTTRDRFNKVLSGDMSSLDRLPVIEWASWWDLTLNRWDKEGLPLSMDPDERFRALGLDTLRQWWFPHNTSDCPHPKKHGGPVIEDVDDYQGLLPYLYPKTEILRQLDSMAPILDEHERGYSALWFTMDGGFWFPRALLGIEPHLYSFYDQPELYHRILDDLAEYQLWVLEQLYARCTPEFMTIAEDMSYNKGPMLSEKLFREFLLPYYRRVIPFIKDHGTHVLIDSDGDITEMVPWLIDAGIEGALPLEFQAGVDVAKLRREFPDFIMVGAFNKRVMKYGEAAMTLEFERLLPVMRQGRFIPSVDHQTPPDVSLANYRIYVKLLHRYAELAVKHQ